MVAQVMHGDAQTPPRSPGASCKNVAFTGRFAYMAGGLSPLQKHIRFVATRRLFTVRLRLGSTLRSTRELR